MAILKTKEIRELSPQDIDEKIKELTTDMGKMSSQVRSGGAPENSGKVREIRRTIARLKTIKREMEAK
jgi:large subunit ribosomal protein L29